MAKYVCCGALALVLGLALAVAVWYVGYGLLPGLIDDAVADGVILSNGSVQLERFYDVPFPLDFKIYFFNVTNEAEVLRGAAPRVREVGPYAYRLYQRRVPEEVGDYFIRYRILNRYEFDSELSFPNSEDDVLNVVNLPYHAILQLAEANMPAAMSLLNPALGSVFGASNAPVAPARVGDLVFGGVRLCAATTLAGFVPCRQIRALSGGSKNLEEAADGSLVFSLFGYKNNKPSELYEVLRGVDYPTRVAEIFRWAGRYRLPYWPGGDGVCTRLNGTDTGVYPPFNDRQRYLYGFNSDICRSVELRFEAATSHEGVPAWRFVANEWFLDNADGCFCLKVTGGVTRPDGCLLAGAQEMATCTGSPTVLTYPHFLYADEKYQNAVVGLTPNVDSHRIFLEVEPKSGTVLRGAKRAQINVFLRPIAGITATQSLATTLTPIFWIEEGMTLPDEYVAEVKRKLVLPLRIVSIVVPALVAFGAALGALGAALLLLALRRALRRPNPTDNDQSDK